MWIVSERAQTADPRDDERIVHQAVGHAETDFQRLACSDGPDDGIPVPGQRLRVRGDHVLGEGQRWCAECFPEKA
jgi:hypothetical protein